MKRTDNLVILSKEEYDNLTNQIQVLKKVIESYEKNNGHELHPNCIKKNE